ncbi:BRCA1-associated RING domain protein 1 isoform X2 [Corapipo altera]|uniref:BRCA1-associated RING domain protein 1 isoform X2 n=1 Tax=Corapipo altera TaxID=415028 RepID=UPI000FD63B4C|nr:BRCA1-associated RING domain protein 1 isoform X2 [Corapipo altera]
MREALRGRSGNQPAPDGHLRTVDPPMASPGQPWSRTRAALGRLERALSCSRCAGVLRQPVSLGQCEHVFCLSCVGDCVGRECPVCHVPAWLRDARINRQLDSMIQLCSKLRELLGTDSPDSAEDASTPPDSDLGKNNKKEQIKMWFSPRSRKIRCVLNKSQPETKSSDPGEDTSSVYDFFPSPPHEKPPELTKKPTQRQNKKMKKKHLAEINQVWKLEKPGQKGVEEKTPKEKCVTICSQPVILCTPEPESPEKRPQQEAVKEDDSSKNTGNVEMPPQVESPEKKDNSEVVCPAQESKENNCAPGTSLSIESETTPLKRGREQPGLQVTPHPKRLRRSERGIAGKAGKAGRQADCLEELPQGSPISPATEHQTPVQISSSVSKLTGTVRKTRSSAVQATDSPSLSKSPSTPSTPKTCSQVSIPFSPSVLKSPGGNTISRRNYKGETLLHVASIKGDLAAVEQLLTNGADPNVKDNAGWTPLHEACNHGHGAVVELLLRRRALVNTTGYQNDSPLHDAARNGHVHIAELLLAHGASRDAVNIFGLRPVDYAESEKMKSVLMLPVKNELLNQPSEALSPSQPRNGPLGLLGSSLSAEQQKLLNKLAAVLKARRCTEFNSEVTHLVIPDVPMPSTVKCMMAVLTGCWVLKFEWVRACLQTSAREQEEKYEIQGGPQRGRLNREQLKSDLVELVRAAGGQILVRQPKPDSDVTQTINTVSYHAEPSSDQRFCTQYVIYDVASKFRPEKTRQGKVWMAPSSWLIDCVMSFQLLPVQ